MGDPRGFLKTPREKQPYRPVAERRRDFAQILAPWPAQTLHAQAARCMDCGVPFCHQGCPLGNRIPDWNDLVSKGRHREALAHLEATNNFPEFTGTLCPAPCEGSCVLAIHDDPVQIRAIELSIIDRGFAEGWIVSQPPAQLTGRTVAVVGSGPAGLAAAQQLRRAGHAVTVFERAAQLGGLLRYGIPDFKFEKRWVDRRLAQLSAEGVVFRAGTPVEPDGAFGPSLEALRHDFDRVLLATGATTPRDIALPGRDLVGVALAMDYLCAQNFAVERGQPADIPAALHAHDKRVVILGGGDTGADCLGTAHRQGARSVLQLDLLAVPPSARAASNPWPEWPLVLRSSPAHEEGGERQWALKTIAFQGNQGQVTGLRAERLDGSGEVLTIEAELVLLALGFVAPAAASLLDAGPLPALFPPRDKSRYETSVPGVFVAGDARRGQSLIVWAIAEGRGVAREIEASLRGAARALPIAG